MWEAAKWLGQLTALIAAIGVLIAGILSRKKRSTERSENKQREASSKVDLADASDKYARLGMALMDRLDVAHRDGEAQQARLNYRTAMETIARNRTHRMSNAYQSAILANLEKEELIRRIVAKLEAMSIALDIDISFVPFPTRTQDEIFGEEDLPLPPEFDKHAEPR